MRSQNWAGGNYFYSERFWNLTCWLDDAPDRRLNRLRLDGEDVSSAVRNLPYSVSAWLVILSAECVKEFETFIRGLPALLPKAMTAVFGTASASFSRYLNVPPLVHAVLLESRFDSEELLFRHDVLFSRGELKLIEVNAVTFVGGWQSGLL